MGKKTLVALDTDHIKQYVFATDRLKEIRGASSILDHLNRQTMEEQAQKFGIKIEKVYTNGGSGLFLVDGDKGQAEAFGLAIQREYNKATCGGATISFATQPIPEDKDSWKDDIQEYLQLLNYRLIMEKARSTDIIALPSHPFMRPCDACGMRYGEEPGDLDNLDPDERDKRFCSVCKKKRQKDLTIKGHIKDIIRDHNDKKDVSRNKKYPYIWRNLISKLSPEGYHLPEDTERPSDFNKLRGISGGKDYLALIYADGNGMGRVMEKLDNLDKRKREADTIDEAIYSALRKAIGKHLNVEYPKGEPPMFPFDVLMLGGDDLMIVTPAVGAFEVALTIAKEFRTATRGCGPDGKGYTLSVSVIIAPIKYPFGLLHDLAADALKHAKTEGARRVQTADQEEPFINFLIVAGGGSNDFETVHNSLTRKIKDGNSEKFYATMRPYTIEDFSTLVELAREGRELSLGRTKLHQLRGTILKMNQTTSVSEALAVLRNWKTEQKDFVRKEVYTLRRQYPEQPEQSENTRWRFPRTIFPWQPDQQNKNAYRTPILDFIEIYDFVKAEEGGRDNGK